MLIRGFRPAFTGALLTLTLSAPHAITAQEQAAQVWSVTTISRIKLEARADYDAWQKQITAAHKKAGIPSRVVLQTFLGDVSEYIVITPLKNLAELDGDTPVQRALGKEGAAALMSKSRPYVTSVHRVVGLDLPELSFRTMMSGAPTLVVATIMRLAPGRARDWESWVRDEYLPAAKKAEIKNFWVSRPVFGGDSNERYIVRPIKSMAELDAGPFTVKALGADGARQVMAKLAGMVQSQETRVVRYRSDLSYQMAPPSTAPASR